MGKNFNRRFTVNLEIDTKTAEKQVKATVDNWKTLISESNFKELADYLKQIDDQLTSFKKKHGDELFGQMFGGLDKNLQKEVEKIFGVAKDQMVQLTQLKEKILNAKENGISEDEIKELEQLTRSLYEAIGLKGEAKLSGRGKIETRLANLESSLNNFALAYENVNNRVSQGFNFDISGGQSGTSAINKKIDETIKKMRELEKVQEDLNNVTKMYSTYQSKKTIEDGIKPNIRNIEKLVRAYDKAIKRRNEFKENGDTTSALYHQNELEIARFSLQGKYLTERYVDNDEDLEEKLSNKKISGLSLLEHLDGMFDDAEKYSNKLIKVQDVVKTAMDNLHANLSQLEKERTDLAQKGTNGDFLNQAKQKIQEINELKTSINDGIAGGSLKDEDISRYLVKITELSTEFKTLAQSAEMSEEEIKNVEAIVMSLSQSLNDSLSKALKQKGKNPIVSFYEDSANEVKKTIDKIAKLDKQFEDAGKPGIQMNAFDKANPSDLQREYIIEAFREYKKNQESAGKIDTNNASEKDIELLEKQLRLIQVIQKARIKGASAQDYGNLYGLEGKELSGFYSLLNDKSYTKYIDGAFDKLRQAISKNREKLVAENEVIAKLIKENEDAWRQFADGKGDGLSNTDQINRKLEEKAAENVKEQKRFNELKSQFDASIKEFTDDGLIDVSGNEQNAYNDILDGIRKNTIQTVEDCKKKFAELAKLDYDELSKKAKELKAQTPAQTGTGGVSGQVKNDVEDAKNRLKELNKIKDEYTGIIDSLNRRKKKTDIKVTKDNDVVVLKQQLDILKQAKEEYLKSKNGTEEEIEAYGKLIKVAKDYQTVVGFIKKSGSENARETIVDKDYLEGSNIANHYLSGMSQGYTYVVKRHFEEMLKSVESDIAKQNTLLSKQLAIEKAITKEAEKRTEVKEKETDTQADLTSELKKKATQYDDAGSFVKNNVNDLKTVGVNSGKLANEFWRNANYTREDFKPVEMAMDDVADIIRNKVPENILDGWFRSADSTYKSKLEKIAITDTEVRNAALNAMWHNFKQYSGKDIGFEEFLHSDIPVYRGKKKEKYIDGDELLSFTFDKSVAEKFGNHVLEAIIKPIDTIGAYQTTGENEVLVRRDQLEAMPHFSTWLNNMTSGVDKSFVQAEIKNAEDTSISSVEAIYNAASESTKKLVDQFYDLTKQRGYFLNNIKGVKLDNFDVFNPTDFQKNYMLETYKELKRVIQEISSIDVVDTDDDKKKLRDLQEEAMRLQKTLSQAYRADGNAYGYMDDYGLSSDEAKDFYDAVRGDKKYNLGDIEKNIFDEYSRNISKTFNEIMDSDDKVANSMIANGDQWDEFVKSRFESIQTAQNYQQQLHEKLSAMAIEAQKQEQKRIQEQNAIKQLEKDFKGEANKIIPWADMNDQEDDAYDAVIEGIRNKTLTTVDECIAKFKELTAVIEAVDDNIPNTGTGNAQARVGSNTTGMESHVSGVSSSEVQDLETLRLKLVEVKRAINDKTDAFQKEATEVGGAVSTEITALTKLLNVLKTISTQIGSIIVSLNNINVDNIDEEFANATKDMLLNAEKIQKAEITPNDLDEMPRKIKELTKAFIDALSEMDNLDNIKLGANIDDAYEKVLENIKNKTFTTVEECIAKFKELTFVGEMDDLDRLNNKLVAVKHAVDSKTDAFKNEAIEVGNAVATEMSALTKLKRLLEEIQGILQTVFAISRGNFDDIEISNGKENVDKVSNAVKNIQNTLSQILGVLQGFTGIESEGKNSVKVKEPAVNNTLSGNEFEGVAEKLRDVATEKTLRSLRRSLLGIENNTKDNKSAEIDDMKSVVSSLVDSITANVKSLKDVTDNVIQYKKDENERRNKKNVDTATQTQTARDLIGKESDEASVTVTKTGDKAVKTTKKVGAEIAQVVKTTNDGVTSTTVTMSNAYKIAMEKTKKQFEDFDSKGYFGALSQNGSNVDAKNLYAEYIKTYYDLKNAMLEYDAAVSSGVDATKIQQKINTLQSAIGDFENRLVSIANNSKAFMQDGTIIGNLDGDEIEKSADSLKKLVVSTESLSVAFHGVFNDGSKLVYEVLDNGTIKRYAVEVDEATGIVKKMEASQYGLVNAMQKVNDAAKQNAALNNILSADGNVNSDSALIKNYMQKRQDLNDAVNDAFNKAANSDGIVDKEDLDIIYAMSQEVIRLGNVINSEYNRISKLINKGGLFNSLGDTTGTTEERINKYMHDYAYGSSKSLSNVQYDSATQTMTADLVDLSGVITKVKVEYSELFDGIQISSLKGTKSVDETAKKIKSLQTALDNMSGHIDQNSQAYTDYKAAVSNLDAVIKQFNDGTLSFNDENIAWWNTLRNSVLSYGEALLSITKNNKSELVSGKSQKTVSFNQYVNSVKDAKYITEDLRDELNTLKTLLEDINDAGDLSNWEEQFNELKNRIAEARAEYNKQDDKKRVDWAKSNQDLKSIEDDAKGIKKALNLDSLDTSDEVVAMKNEYNNLMKKITEYKARREALTEEELAELKEIFNQLQTNSKAYAEQHPKAKKNKKTYGTGIMNTHTDKYNRMGSYEDLLQESNEYKKLYKKYVDSYTNVQNAYNDFETKGENDDTIKRFKEASAECNRLHKELERLLNTYRKMHDDPNKIGEQGLFNFVNTEKNRQKALEDYVQSIHGNRAKIEGFKDNYRELVYTIDNGDGTFTKAKARIDNLGTAIVETAGDTKVATSKFGKVFEEIGKKFGSLSTYFISMVSVQEVFQFLRQGVTYVRDIDAALTELKKVTDETDATYDRFLQNMSKTANVVGSSVSELTTMAAEWAKLGYSIEESAKLAESTAILLNVSEFEDATTASEALISTMQAFQYTADESGHVVDILNEVGNNYAVSSDELAVALQDSASALMEGGNNLEQSVALVAAANKVVQDPSSVGGALRTISLRLRGTSVEVLEELGEETDNVVEGVSKLQSKIKALSGVNILTDSGEYKDTYTILKEIGQVWGSMSDMNQAALLELMAGKNRANVLSAILSNMQDLEGAYVDALSAEGSALKENEAYLDSIQGRIDLFTNSVQTMWMNFINDDVVKFLVDVGTLLVNLIDKFGAIETILVGYMGYLTFIKKMNWNEVSNSIRGFFKRDKSSGILEGEAIDQEIDAMKKAASEGKEAFDSYINSAKSARNGMKIYAEQCDVATASADGYTNAMKNMSAEQKKSMQSANDAARAQTKHNIIMMAASTAFTVLGSMIKKLVDGNDSLSESYEKLQSSISTLTSDIDSLSSELESVQDRIEELSGKELTLTESEELQALKKQSAELERQIGLKQTLLDGREQQNQVTTLAKINEMLKTTAEGQVDAVEKAKTWGYWLGRVADTALIIGGVAVSGMSFGGAAPLGAAMIGAGSSGIASELISTGAGVVANKFNDTENGTLIEWYESYKDAIEKAQLEASIAENKYLQSLSDEDYEAWQKKVNKLSGLQTDLYDGLEELQGYMSNLEYNDVTGPIIDAYNDMMAQIEIENVGDGVQSRIDAIKALETEYNTLSKGLDKNGNNVALSSEEYSRYQAIVKQLIAYSPDLIQGYDAEGNAILNRNNLIDDGIRLIQEQQQAEAKAMIESEKLSETYKSLQDAKNDKINSVKDIKTDTLGNLNANIRKGEISNVVGIEFDPNVNLSEYIVNNADAVRENMDAILASASKSLSIEELAIYKAYLNDIFAQLDNIDIELSEGLRSSLYNVPIASDYYNELESSHISFINSYINSLGDLSNVTDAEFAQITNSMLALTDTIGANENIQQLVDNLFTVNPDVPAKIYEDTLNQALQELINHGIASEDMKEALLAELFPDKSNVNTMSSFIRQKLNDIYDYAVDGLSVAELKIAYKFVADVEDGSIEWTDIEEQLKKEIDIKSIDAYSALSESVSKYQEILQQASEITTDGTLITQELRDELTALGVTEEDFSKCLSENNKLLVENADAFNEVVKSAKETEESNIKIAKSRAQLKYNDLINELDVAIESYEGFTEETQDATNAIIDQIGTIKQSINQYQQLEDTLLGTTSAFDKFAKAQEIDSQNTYGESYVTMAQTMYDAIYKTGEVGSAQFWAAVEATVPSNIYAHLLPGKDQINAITDYLNNNVFQALTFSDDSFSIDYSAIEDFVSKAQEVGVFTGKDASVFGLSPEFIYGLEEDENALKAFADRMGMTITQVYTYLSEMDKYNANGFGLNTLLQLDNSITGQITNVNNELEQLYIRRKALIEQRTTLANSGEDTTEVQLQLDTNWEEIAKYEAQLTNLHGKATATVEEFAKIDNIMLKIGDIDGASVEEIKEIIPDEIETQLALTGDETVEEIYQKLIDYRSQFEEPAIMELDIAQDQIEEELNSLIEQFGKAKLEANVVVDENGLREVKDGKLTIDADTLERYVELKNANLFIDNSLAEGLTTSEQYLSRIADNTDIMAGKDDNGSGANNDKGGGGSTNGGGAGFNGNPTPPAELVPNTFEYWEIKKQLDKVASDYYSETGGGGAGVYGQPYDPYNPENIEYEVENLNDATQETTKSTEVLLKQYDILLNSLSGIDSAVLIQPNELNSLGFGTITTEAIGAANAIEIVQQKKEALVQSESTSSLIDIVNVEKGVLTYSELQEKVASFNDVLSQTDEIIENDTEVSQEYIDSLRSLCETQEEINELEESYYVKNGKLIVKNASMIKKLVAQKKQDQKASIKQAKSGAQLQYKNTIQQLQVLIKAMALEVKATGLVSSATINNIDVLRDQIDTIKKTIQQYALLEVGLSDAANAYSEFESAKERDAQLSYDDSMLEMIQVLNDGFKTGKVGTEAFQFAVEAIVPYEAYGHIDDLEQRMIAIHDYVDKNPLFADWFIIDEGEFSIAFDNITNFIKDGIDKGVFTGTVEDFELGDVSSIEEMAAAFGQTEAVILAMLSAMEDYDASWGNIITDLTTNPLDREIIKATDALDEALIAQEAFIKSGGDLDGDEYQQLVENVESARNALENATKEADNYTAKYTNIQTAYAALTGEITLTKQAAEKLFETLGFVDEYENVTVKVDDDGTIHMTQEQLDILNNKADSLEHEPTLMSVQLQYDTIDADIAELKHYVDNELGFSNSDVAIKYNITNQKEAEDEIARLTAVQKTISLTYGITTTTTEQSAGTIEKLTTWETNGVNINISGNTEQLQAAIQTVNALEMAGKEVAITADPTQANADIDSVDNNNIEDKEPKIYIQGVPVAISKIDSISDALDKLKNKTINVTVNKTTYESTKKTGGGTVRVNGTANADGNWGAPKTETSLVGELGPEILVRNGKWTTVGANGAEFTQVRKGDIIFNHKQTQDLLSKGYVTGRGKIKGGAFASGTVGDNGTAYYGAVGPYVGDNDVFKNGSDKWMDPYANKISGAADALSNAANSVSDAADEFNEIFDWIEIRLEEINESISLHSAKLENTIGFDKQNKVIDEMIELNQALYNNLIAGANKYYAYAEKLLSKVPSAYREAAQDGTIAIEEFVGEVDEKTLEAIQEYREWVQKGSDATQQAEEALTEISNLARQAIDNISQDFENKTSLNSNRIEQLEAYNALIETDQGFESESIYQAIIDANNANIEQLKKQRKEMQAELDAQVNTGNIKKYSQDWYDAINAIAEVDTEIIELTTDTENYQDAINELHWDKFDALINRLEAVSNEAENLIDILSSKDLVDESGNWTDEGITTLGLYAQQMEAAEVQAKKYQEEVEYLNENWQELGYTEEEYIEKLEDLKEGQYDAIKSYNDTKDAIVDLNKERIEAIKEGIQKEIDAYEELIQKQKEELDVEKDLHGFQNSIMEQEKDVADLKRQLAALSGDNSASARAKKAQLEAELAKAQADLEESYYERSLQNKQDALDKELENYQDEKDAEMEALDEYLENTEKVVSDSLATIQANTDTVYQTLTAMGEEYSLSITEHLTSPWKEGEYAIQSFAEQFGISMSATIAELEELELKLKETMSEIERSGTESAGVVDNNAQGYTQAEYKAPSSSNSSGNNSSSSSGNSNAGLVSNISGNIKYGDKGANVKKLQQALNALGYGNSGTTSVDGIFGKQTQSAVKKFQKDMGVSSDGIVGPKTKAKFKLKGYSVGTTSIDEDQWAILDELGDELQLVPGKNGRLAYVKMGTGIVPADLTERIMNLAMDPQGMLDQNRPSIGVHPEIHNTEINLNITYGDMVSIGEYNGNNLADIEKMVAKQFDKHTKDLNNALRKYVR